MKSVFNLLLSVAVVFGQVHSVSAKVSDEGFLAAEISVSLVNQKTLENVLANLKIAHSEVEVDFVREKLKKEGVSLTDKIKATQDGLTVDLDVAGKKTKFKFNSESEILIHGKVLRFDAKKTLTDNFNIWSQRLNNNVGSYNRLMISEAHAALFLPFAMALALVAGLAIIPGSIILNDIDERRTIAALKKMSSIACFRRKPGFFGGEKLDRESIDITLASNETVTIQMTDTSVSFIPMDRAASFTEISHSSWKKIINSCCLNSLKEAQCNERLDAFKANGIKNQKSDLGPSAN